MMMSFKLIPADVEYHKLLVQLYENCTRIKLSFDWY